MVDFEKMAPAVLELNENETTDLWGKPSIKA